MSLFKSTKKEEHCPDCGAILQIKQGKRGLFLGCTNYPKCEYIKPLQQNYHVIKTLEESCPECGHLLQIKQGHLGMFIGCSNYPTCHFIVHEQQEESEETNFICPECKQHQLIARKGRAGKIFYGCRGYPQCKFTLTHKPVLKTCPQCHCTLATQKKEGYYQCANKHCQHIFKEEPNE